MLSSIKRNVSNITRHSAFQIAVLGAALSLTPSGSIYAQADSDEEEEVDEEGSEVEEEEAEDEAEEEAPSAPKLRIEAGAPRPPAQTPGIAPPTLPPGAIPPPPTIKLGGAFILAYFQPYNMGEEAQRQNRPRPEANFETFRAAILLDSKIDRYGVHIEFRARDRRVREFADSTAWLEEIYGSVDIIKPDNAIASAVLKVGRSFTQFGRFWDDSFYGNVHLRDGLKLDTNYGLSLEGQVGKRQLGAKFFGQYYITDGGGTNTSLNNRDTISNPAPLSGHPPVGISGTTAGADGSLPGALPSMARKRNMFVARLEPFYAFNPTMSVKIAGSIQNFTADFGPTKAQENVLRYSGDTTLTLAWFSAWAEYTKQKGYSTRNYPFPPRPATGSPAGTPAPLLADPPSSSKDVDYLLAGGRFFYKGVMLRYNYSQVRYHGVSPLPAAAVAGLARANVDGDITVTERMHVPGIMISATQQLFLMIEAPLHKRSSPAIDVPAPVTAAAKIPSIAKSETVIDRSIVVTLHARI